MDSKSGKDGAFAAWIKLLIKTYLDLFLRLIIIHFIIFIIMSLVNSGFYSRITDQGFIGYMTFIAIIIGLLAFAKEAPKFMKDALGLKGDGFSLFGGLGAALGVGAAAAGVASGAISGAAAQFKNTDGKMPWKIGAGLLGGIGGAIGGGVNSGKALLKGDKMGKASDVRKANRAYAAQNYAHAADGSTLGGRLIAGAQGNAGIQNKFQRMKEKIDGYENHSAATERLKGLLDKDDRVKKAASELEMAKARGDYDAVEGWTDAQGVHHEGLKKKLAKARAGALASITSADYKGLTVAEKQIYQEAEKVYNSSRHYENEAEFKEFADLNKNSNDMKGFYNNGLDAFDAIDHSAANAKNDADLNKNSKEFKAAEDINKRINEQNSKK